MNSNPTYSYLFDSILLHPPLISLFGLPGSLWFPRQCWSVHLSTCQILSQNLYISLLQCFNFWNMLNCSPINNCYKMGSSDTKQGIEMLPLRVSCVLHLPLQAFHGPVLLAPEVWDVRLHRAEQVLSLRDGRDVGGGLVELLPVDDRDNHHDYGRGNHVVGCHAKHLPVVL